MEGPKWYVTESARGKVRQFKVQGLKWNCGQSAGVISVINPRKYLKR